MVVLRKVKASTLMETLVATVLIVVVFMLASMILNNLFSNSIKSNTRVIDTHLDELQYLYINDKIPLPYSDDFEDWEIDINHLMIANQKMIQIEAVNTKTNLKVTRSSIAN